MKCKKRAPAVLLQCSEGKALFSNFQRNLTNLQMCVFVFCFFLYNILTNFSGFILCLRRLSDKSSSCSDLVKRLLGSGDKALKGGHQSVELVLFFPEPVWGKSTVSSFLLTSSLRLSWFSSLFSSVCFLSGRDYQRIPPHTHTYTFISVYFSVSS